jgi:hypothetical protein
MGALFEHPAGMRFVVERAGERIASVELTVASGPIGGLTEDTFVLPESGSCADDGCLFDAVYVEMLGNNNSCETEHIKIIDEKYVYQFGYLAEGIEDWMVTNNSPLISQQGSWIGNAQVPVQQQEIINNDVDTENTANAIRGFAGHIEQNHSTASYDWTGIACPLVLRKIAAVKGAYRLTFDYQTFYSQPVHKEIGGFPLGPFFVETCGGWRWYFGRDREQQDGAIGAALVFVGNPECEIRFCVQGNGKYVIDNVSITQMHYIQ